MDASDIIPTMVKTMSLLADRANTVVEPVFLYTVLVPRMFVMNQGMMFKTHTKR